MQLRTALRVALPIITLLIFAPFFLKSPFAKGENNYTETTYYFLTDHLGSVDVVLDDEGNVVERADYLPYGSDRLQIADTDTPDTDYKFTGKELDDETGLMYYGARYYDSGLGRFISFDPLLLNEGGKPLESVLPNPQALNPYSYVTNNPVRFVDETGEYQIEVHFDLTLFLAKSAGFSDDNALDLAYSDQQTDVNKITSPYNIDNGWMHFVDENVATMWLDSGIKDKRNLTHYGSALHFFQDTFSHSGHGYDWFEGGHIADSILSIFGLAKNTDKTYEYPDDGMEMAKGTFEYLRKYMAEVNGTGDLSREEFDAQTTQIWDDVETTVSSFVNANDEQQKDFFGLTDEEKTYKDLSTKE